jgi:hypothetical protein
VAGISGNKDGAFSIALSGGYEDDVDLGEALYAVSYFLLEFALNVLVDRVVRSPAPAAET